MAGQRFTFYAPQVWTRQRRILMPTASILGTHLCNAFEVARMNDMIAAGLLEVTEPEVAIEIGPTDLLPRLKDNGYDNERVAKRREWVEKKCGTTMPHIGGQSWDFEATRGNIENLIGVGQIPMGVAGPVLVHGKYAKGLFYVPMATTEGVHFVPHDGAPSATSPVVGPMIDTVLLPGHYDVWYVPTAPTCDSSTSPSPCVSVRVLTDVVMTATPVTGPNTTQKVDVEISSLPVTGRVTWNGMDLPATGRGSLDFLAAGAVAGGSHTTVPVASAGPADYRAVLGPANFIVRYLPTAGATIDCHDTTLLSCMPLTTLGCN